MMMRLFVVKFVIVMFVLIVVSNWSQELRRLYLEERMADWRCDGEDVVLCGMCCYCCGFSKVGHIGVSWFGEDLRWIGGGATRMVMVVLWRCSWFAHGGGLMKGTVVRRW